MQTFTRATLTEDYAIARVLWPVLRVAEKATAWDVTVDVLLHANLPVEIYDLAVAALHPLPVSKFSWDEAVAELRRLGYEGSVSMTVGVLRRMVQDRLQRCPMDI